MDKDTRNAIDRATQRARKLLEEDFASQLEGDFDVHKDGTVAATAGGHLSPRQAYQRERIVAAIEHKRAAGMNSADSVADYLRDAAFTTLNRFVALKMLEARELVLECISRGEQSGGYREFCGMAPGLQLLPDGAGYRLYIESIFDELSTEVKVLFDRRDTSSVLWPKRATFELLLADLNTAELARAWGEDETIGWVYQFFNGLDERRKMREESAVPRNSRELAVRNQFFTPRYVVQFLADNTLGRIWYEMRGAETVLAERCSYLVPKPNEALARREKKDPRDLRLLDPACGSGHFLLYAFDLLIQIYEEAHSDPQSPESVTTGRRLAEEYPSLDELRKAIPSLVLAHNLHGVDIDLRCAQIAQLALWMRAQRAYHDMGTSRSDRLPIRRSKITVAEPLVAEQQISNKFVSELSDPELGRVFTSLVESLNLAGELGVLLPVERLVGSEANGGKTGDLFAPSVGEIRAALERFDRAKAVTSNAQRQLFVDDAKQAISLLILSEQKFDVVLMNPPFGEATTATASEIGRLYPEWNNNLLCAFLMRAGELISNGGLTGLIFDRTAVVKSSYEPFRRTVLLPGDRIEAFCDLGWSVLDANVEVAACVVNGGHAPQSGTFIDVRTQPPELKGQRLEAIVKSVQANPSERLAVFANSSTFLALPNAVVGYDFPEFLRRAFENFHALQHCGYKAHQGFALKADKHFRLWWELGSTTSFKISRMFNGSGYAPYSTNLIDCAIAAVYPEDLPMDSSTRKSGLGQHRKPGVCFGKRGEYLTAHLLPAGHIFTVEGQAIPVDAADDALELLAYLNTPLVRFSLNKFCGQHKYSGYLNQLPFLRLSDGVDARGLVLNAIAAAERARGYDEIQPQFTGIAPVQSFEGWADELRAAIDAAGQAARECELICDNYARRLLEVTEADAKELDLFRDSQPSLEPPIEDADLATDCRWIAAHTLVSFGMGLVMGRWLASNYRGGTSFSVSQLYSGWPLESEASTPRLASGNCPSILVFDEGHADHIVTRIGEQLEKLLKSTLADDEPAIAKALGFSSIGEYLRLPGGFFGDHLRRYSKSRRKAPIYWQFGTPTASYSVWLYIHSFSKDALFRVQSDYVEKKVEHEERRLESLTSDLRDSATAAQRKKLAAQEGFVQELRAFLEELRRVAPLWNPNLDDGVIINFAPLWRLVPHHKSWQKELKSTFDALCEGQYDWAHLAMHLWPERVLPKCAKERSLALAHNLEDVFWVQGTDGKWSARKSPTREIGELVRERTSPAVKSALKSLLDAPVAIGNTGRMRGGRSKSPAGENS